MGDSNPDLERFRKQWKDEVTARTRQTKTFPVNADSKNAGPSLKPLRPTKLPPAHHPAANTKHGDQSDDDEVDTELADGLERSTLGEEDDWLISTAAKEPKSAIEHYEKAVEKEVQGKLGDSLSHYRKAYRLDAKVDQTYKNKHFPSSSKPSNPIPPNTTITVPSTAHHSSNEPSSSAIPFLDLISNYARLPIPRADPILPGDPPPPCPIADIPSEILEQIILQCAIHDPANFARLGQVCRRLSFYLYNEKAVWKRVALGPEFGLDGQLYDFGCDLQGRELIYSALSDEHPSPQAGTLAFSNDKERDWREVFHSHTRVRYTGVYISTVNYTRAGGASATHATWNNPFHIVTYYRYLRFYRDGTVISLLTTHEPIDVVHHLTWENMRAVKTAGKEQQAATSLNAPAQPGQPVPHTSHSIMKHALRGRWRLCHPLSSEQQGVRDIATGGAGMEGDLHIETEGAGPRYMYTMHLSLMSSSRSKNGVKNNKLVWKGFWSYNHLTSDWAEFHLKNDKPFFFSRVKSYGLGY